MHYQEIITFWFEELEPAQHWVKDEALDQQIEARFGAWHQAATRSECYTWRQSAEGRLAEILLLDQFSRNIFRDQPESFAYDGMSLILAQEAINVKADMLLPIDQRAFIYLPFMHSESLVIHQEAMLLFSQAGLEHNLEFERKHLEILERFGRYPHRNDILGRESTAEEMAFLKQPGSSF